MAKYAQIKILDSVLANGELSHFLLIGILKALPSDTKIKDFDDEAGGYYIMVESSSYIDNIVGQPCPQIIVNFSKIGGIPYITSVDQSAALWAYSGPLPTPVPVTQCSCGICWVCFNTGISSNLRGPTIIPPGALQGSPPTGIQKRSGYSLVGNSASFTEGCKADWKEYLGLNESYKYCTKCNKKESQHG